MKLSVIFGVLFTSLVASRLFAGTTDDNLVGAVIPIRNDFIKIADEAGRFLLTQVSRSDQDNPTQLDEKRSILRALEWRYKNYRLKVEDELWSGSGAGRAITFLFSPWGGLLMGLMGYGDAYQGKIPLSPTAGFWAFASPAIAYSTYRLVYHFFEVRKEKRIQELVLDAFVERAEEWGTPFPQGFPSSAKIEWLVKAFQAEQFPLELRTAHYRVPEPDSYFDKPQVRLWIERATQMALPRWFRLRQGSVKSKNEDIPAKLLKKPLIQVTLRRFLHLKKKSRAELRWLLQELTTEEKRLNEVCKLKEKSSKDLENALQARKSSWASVLDSEKQKAVQEILRVEKELTREAQLLKVVQMNLLKVTTRRDQLEILLLENQTKTGLSRNLLQESFDAAEMTVADISARDELARSLSDPLQPSQLTEEEQRMYDQLAGKNGERCSEDLPLMKTPTTPPMSSKEQKPMKKWEAT